VYLDAAQIHGVVTAAMGCIKPSFEALECVSMPSQWDLLTLCHGHPLQDRLLVTSIYPTMYVLNQVVQGYCLSQSRM
jgi:hypothetical protein